MGDIPNFKSGSGMIRASPAASIAGKYYAVLGLMMKVRDEYYELRGKIFDVRHGTETGGIVPVTGLVLPEQFRAASCKYQATKISVFSQ